MKFLLDVHIGTTIAQTLVQAGHDVARAALLYPTWEDEQLIALAVSEARIIVTQDSDFTDLIFGFGVSPPPAVIYLRCNPVDQARTSGLILDLLKNPRLLGYMIVITSVDIRFRHFPVKDIDHDRL